MWAKIDVKGINTLSQHFSSERDTDLHIQTCTSTKRLQKGPNQLLMFLSDMFHTKWHI